MYLENDFSIDQTLSVEVKLLITVIIILGQIKLFCLLPLGDFVPSLQEHLEDQISKASICYIKATPTLDHQWNCCK